MATETDSLLPLQGQSDRSERIQSRLEKRESFIVQFAGTKGPPQIALLVLLTSIGFGCTAGIVPAVMTDRFAVLKHGLVDNDTLTCGDYDIAHKPPECLAGSADAQNGAAYANLIENMLIFVTSPLIGSLSDTWGRRRFLLMGFSLSFFSPLCLVATMLIPNLSPWWFYGSQAVTGLVNWVAIAMASLSDVLPPSWRSAGFGLILSVFSLGMAIAPNLAVIFDHFQVSLISLGLVTMGFISILLFFPETLPATNNEREGKLVENAENEDTWMSSYGRMVLRPFQELSIINRDAFFRTLSALAFFSGIVSTADRTLLLYYVEERLEFNDRDIAVLMTLNGFLSIIAQGVLIKPLTGIVGERWVVILAFLLGCMNNLLYGLATNKFTIFVAACVGTFAGMAYPTISAIKANSVEAHEQGRIQGALFSVQAVASGLGPMLLRFVYSQTKDNAYPGAGTMFLVAALLYLVAVLFACALSVDRSNSSQKENIDVGRSDLGVGKDP